LSYTFSPLVLLAFMWLSLSSCDDTLTPKDFDEQESFVRNLSITPSDLVFDELSDGIKDTTITISFSVEGINFDPDSTPYYSIFFNDEDIPSIQDPLISSGANQFSNSFSFSTKTYFFETYSILVTPTLSGNSVNYSQSRILQKGVPFNSPDILEANNPQEVSRPSSGRINVRFEAKATDIDRQRNLDGVFLRLISRSTGEVNNSPFELFDDGTQGGDQVSRDSVFTLTLPVNSGNQLQTYDILYYAIDKSGLVSDTVKTIFRIVE